MGVSRARASAIGNPIGIIQKTGSTAAIANFPSSGSFPGSMLRYRQSVSVTFPTPFPYQCVDALGQFNGFYTVGLDDGEKIVACSTTGLTTTGLNLFISAGKSSATRQSNGGAFTWRAWGI